MEAEQAAEARTVRLTLQERSTRQGQAADGDSWRGWDRAKGNDRAKRAREKADWETREPVARVQDANAAPTSPEHPRQPVGPLSA